MNCPEAEQLCSYRRDHALSKRQQSALAKHLADCAACRCREHSYEDLLGGLRDQPTRDSRQDLFQQALARIDFEEATTLSSARVFSLEQAMPKGETYHASQRHPDRLCGYRHGNRSDGNASAAGVGPGHAPQDRCGSRKNEHRAYGVLALFCRTKRRQKTKPGTMARSPLALKPG